MTVTDYRNIISENGFEEYPILNDGTALVSRFINFAEADIDLKIYLNKLILCRSYYGTYTAWYPDVEWFAQNFFREMQRDFIKPELSETIKFAAGMILADEPFTKGIIGTNFMFGVIEFYAKHKLGFRPMALLTLCYLAGFLILYYKRGVFRDFFIFCIILIITLFTGSFFLVRQLAANEVKDILNRKTDPACNIQL
jgi:hypothetical protein